MFVGRVDLISLVKRAVEVGEGPELPPETPRGADRPVLVIEGLGGSGRSEFLRFTWKEWAKKTPTVWVNPKFADSVDHTSLRPILVAVMQGLSSPVPGYGQVKFPRVVLAHIAMGSPISQVDPARARAELRERMNRYRDRRNLIGFVGELIKQFGGVLGETQAPGGGKVVGQAIAEQAAQRIVDSLGQAGWLARLGWDDALTWFGHQDMGLPFDPVDSLIQLSRQASIRDPEVQKDVDELLIAALLADLRESLSQVKGRPWNALILMNDGDRPKARSFIAALIRVREMRALRAPAAESPLADPVVVLATSGGVLAPTLRMRSSEQPDSEAPAPTGSRWWLPIQLGELTEQDIHAMAKDYRWPPALGLSKVVHAVHRVTRGHASATDLLLRELRNATQQANDLDAVQQVNDLDAVLRPAEEQLLNQIVAGVNPNGEVDGPLHDQLVTCSAARNQYEAERLLTWLNEAVHPALMASTTLWAGRDGAGLPVLPPFVRYLGLSALAGRGADDERGWHTVFTTLRGGADEEDDQAGRLHHRLALGDTGPAVKELTDLLNKREDEHWLALLDQITMTPDLRTPPSMPRSAARLDALVDHLVATLRAARDPRLTDLAQLRTGYGMLAADLRLIAGSSPAFQQRAQHYDRLADGSR